MIVKICDVCQQELGKADNPVDDRIKEAVSLAGITVDVEVILGIGGVWNQGELCFPCVKDAVIAAFLTRDAG